VDREQAAALLRAGLDHLVADGIEVTAEGVERAGAVLRAAEARLTDADWAALRRGPAVWREHLADREH
jgi:hypothetical protein